MTKDKHIRLKMVPAVNPTVGAGGQLMNERITFTPVKDAKENKALVGPDGAAPQGFVLPVWDRELFGLFTGAEEVTLDFAVTKRAPALKVAKAEAPKARKSKSTARRLVSVKRK